jgi:succinate dehydrogenase/fumarate reductase-like Fe-S protein
MIRAKEEMTVSALRSFPVLRDLAIDRRPVTEFFSRRQLHLALPEAGERPALFCIPPAYDELAKCTECLACMAECSSFDLRDESFGGPLTFVKLAQLHLDPRDSQDRRAQAKGLGVTTCVSCKTRCSCPIGVPIYRAAIEPLL